MGWYEDAGAYDLAFSFPPERETAFLLEVFRRAKVPPGSWVAEPMAGTGRLHAGLVRRGYRMLGLDRSRAMLERARSACPDSCLVLACAEEFRLAPGSLGAAICLIDSFRYLVDDSQVAGFFAGLAEALRPGAPLVIGLDLADPAGSPDEEWTASRGTETARVRLSRSAAPGTHREWLDAEIVIEGPRARTVRSRALQRIWTPLAFCALLDGLSAFGLAGIWRRSYDLGRPLDAIPESGGPVVVALVREADQP